MHGILGERRRHGPDITLHGGVAGGLRRLLDVANVIIWTSTTLDRARETLVRALGLDIASRVRIMHRSHCSVHGFHKSYGCLREFVRSELPHVDPDDLGSILMVDDEGWKATPDWPRDTFLVFQSGHAKEHIGWLLGHLCTWAVDGTRGWTTQPGVVPPHPKWA
jgi:hypothetical protein